MNYDFKPAKTKEGLEHQLKSIFKSLPNDLLNSKMPVIEKIRLGENALECQAKVAEKLGEKKTSDIFDSLTDEEAFTFNQFYDIHCMILNQYYYESAVRLSLSKYGVMDINNDDIDIKDIEFISKSRRLGIEVPIHIMD